MQKLFKIISFIILGLICASLLFIYFCPLSSRYSMPAGKYCVGNQLLYFKDHENKYQLNKINEFNVDVFYPSNATIQQKFTYRPDYYNAIKNIYAQKTHIPYFIVNLLMPDLQPYAQPNAPIIQNSTKFPVIITLPGIGGSGINVMLPTELASQGYIVCAIEPPADILVTIFPDGKQIHLDQTLQNAIKKSDRKTIYEYRDQAHARWINYINMTIDQLQKLNNDPASIWYQRLDLDHVGLLGHSHGGAVALDYCQKYSRCKAGINLDGWTKTYNVPDSFKTPFLLLMGQHGGIIDIPQVKDLIENNKRPDFQAITIQGAYHGSFGDGILTPWPWNYIFGESLKNPEKIRLEINNDIVHFFDRYLK